MTDAYAIFQRLLTSGMANQLTPSERDCVRAAIRDAERLSTWCRRLRDALDMTADARLLEQELVMHEIRNRP